MWHESRDEMLEMFKSIFRMDLDQCARKAAKDTLRSASAKNNYYDFESELNEILVKWEEDGSRRSW